MPAAKRLVKFVGGPCDGLECRCDSADRFESSIAIVWSLFRVGCGGPLIAPETLKRRQTRKQRNPKTAVAPSGGEGEDSSPAYYRVIRRTLQGGILVSIAWHAPPQHRSP